MAGKLDVEPLLFIGFSVIGVVDDVGVIAERGPCGAGGRSGGTRPNEVIPDGSVGVRFGRFGFWPNLFIRPPARDLWAI